MIKECILSVLVHVHRNYYFQISTLCLCLTGYLTGSLRGSLYPTMSPRSESNKKSSSSTWFHKCDDSSCLAPDGFLKNETFRVIYFPFLTAVILFPCRRVTWHDGGLYFVDNLFDFGWRTSATFSFSFLCPSPLPLDELKLYFLLWTEVI